MSYAFKLNYNQLSSSPLVLLLFCFCLMAAPVSHAQVTLSADGPGNTYELINQVLGGNIVETPDCIHTSFGRHIAEAYDDILQKHVFVFKIHVTPDDDRCLKQDRQRVEIKTYNQSPAHLKATYGETVTYSWKFKLPAGFKTSPKFTHIHQIKPGDGPEDLPVITLTPRYNAKGDRLEIIHTGAGGVLTKPTPHVVDLAPFIDTWVEVHEKITYTTNGQYEISIKRVSDGHTLLAYQNNNLNMWRTGTTFMRPKWGIYRSLDFPEYLRDEEVLFADFCIAEGEATCAAGNPTGMRKEVQTNPAPVLVYPNPVRKNTTVDFTLQYAGQTTIAVYNLAGASEKILLDTYLPAGKHSALLDTSSLARGMYLLRVVNAQQATSKVILRQ